MSDWLEVMIPLRGGLSSAGIESGVLYVTRCGMWQMLLWCAGS